MTTTAGDAEAYRELGETLRKHRGDTQAWGRLGEMLRVQRQMLDRRYSNRRAFANERGLNYKAVYDIERAATGGRTDFTLDSVLTLAEGYNVSYQSIGAALEGGELEPLTTPPPRLAAVPPLPASDEDRAIQAILRADGDPLPEFSPGIRAALATHLPGLMDTVEQAARAEAGRRDVSVLDVLKEVPPASVIFPAGSTDAELWDEWRERGYLGVKFTTGQLIWGLAMRHLQDEVRAQQTGGSGSG